MTEQYYQRDELVGKEVYTIKAVHVGTVKDVAYAKDGRTALVIAVGNKQQIVPFSEISEIADIILVKKTAEAPTGQEPITSPAERPATSTCPKCNHENRVGAKFCLKCGSRLSQNVSSTMSAVLESDAFSPRQYLTLTLREIFSNPIGVLMGFISISLIALAFVELPPAQNELAFYTAVCAYGVIALVCVRRFVARALRDSHQLRHAG